MPFHFFGENNDNVEIKQSKIKNAGRGLFATKNFAKGEFICWYFGCLIEKDFVENGYYDSDYLLHNPHHSDLIIDAEDEKSCYGRYINDSLGLKKNNCEFNFYTDTTSVGIIATKNIKNGDEIYISYGIDFWREDRRYNLLNKRNRDYINNRDDGIEL